MNIIITDISGASIFVVPIVPSNTPITSDGSNDTVEGIDRRFRTINNKELRTIEWSSFFPVKKDYNFVRKGSLADGYLYVLFLELMKKYKLPVRLILTTNEKVPFFNMLMTIDKFSYKFDKLGDIDYTITLTEFPEIFYKFTNIKASIKKHVGNLKENLEKKALLQKLKLLFSEDTDTKNE